MQCRVKQSHRDILVLLKHVTVGVPFFVALALGSASLGYFLGRGTATPEAVDHKHTNEPAPENSRTNEDRGDSDGSDEADGDLGRIQPEPAEECKLVRILIGNCSLGLSLMETWRSSWYGATLT
jgi:hypothetical protein